VADAVGEAGGVSVSVGLLVNVGTEVWVGEGMIVRVEVGGGMKGVLLGVGVVLIVGVGVIVEVLVVVAVKVKVGVWLKVAELLGNGGVKLVVGVRVT
jgi:hypothetical protein